MFFRMSSGITCEFVEARTKLTEHHYVLSTEAELNGDQERELAGEAVRRAIELASELGMEGHYLIVRSGHALARRKTTHWHIAVMPADEKAKFLIAMAERNK